MQKKKKRLDAFHYLWSRCIVGHFLFGFCATTLISRRPFTLAKTSPKCIIQETTAQSAVILRSLSAHLSWARTRRVRVLLLRLRLTLHLHFKRDGTQQIFGCQIYCTKESQFPAGERGICTIGGQEVTEWLYGTFLVQHKCTKLKISSATMKFVFGNPFQLAQLGCLCALLSC